MTASAAPSRAEAAAGGLTTAAALLVVGAYGLDRTGLAFRPWPMLALALAASLGAYIWLTRPIPFARGRGAPHARGDGADGRTDLSMWVAVTVGVFSWLMWLARPSFLPLATGPDLTHHLLLIDRIERQWRLVHDPGVEQYLGEMAYYTPGSHVIVALVGAWTRLDGVRVLHACMSAAVALKAGWIYLIARRLVSPAPWGSMVSLLAPLSLLAAPAFFVGAVVHDAFTAQVVAELFMFAALWSIAVWWQSGRADAMAACGWFTAAAFLTWPVLAGPPMATLGVLAAILATRGAPRVHDAGGREGAALSRRHIAHIALAGAILAPVAGDFLAERIGWLRIAATGGTTTVPTVADYGVLFLAVSTLGLLLSLFGTQRRAVGAAVTAMAAQTLALYLVARWQHNTPYMALKMTYPWLGLQALGISLACDAGATRFTALRRLWPGRIRIVAATLVAACAFFLARDMPGRLGPLRPPAITRPLLNAAEWARSRVPTDCIEYLVPNDWTAYWLHLAALGNPRMSARTADDSTFEITAGLVRWLTPLGRRYAIVDLPAIPSGVRDELDVVASFGSAAIARRRDTASCGM